MFPAVPPPAATQSHPVRVRGLKRALASLLVKFNTSHPVRVRGLKHWYDEEPAPWWTSHPVRVRGLKLELLRSIPATWSRTPCGCVG